MMSMIINIDNIFLQFQLYPDDNSHDSRSTIINILVFTFSAEAELFAMCKLAAGAIGVGRADVGQDAKVTTCADAWPALAIAKRRGAGKIKDQL